MPAPVRFAVIGMGGFAQTHFRALQVLEAAGEAKLVATCDPNPGAFLEKRREWRFEERGVKVYGDYLEMLDACKGELDVVTVPTPIPLHAAMHKACVDRGLACYLEKPPTLDPVELEEMIATDARARVATQVGFNFIVEPHRLEIKKRCLAGEYGALREVRFLGHWPRPTAYYARAAWAGRVSMDGRMVLDSPVGNAMAHYMHNSLFWTGKAGVLSWGEVDELRAEIYRSHAIQGPDTFFISGRTDTGVPFRFALSHACLPGQFHVEEADFEKARFENDSRKGWQDGWSLEAERPLSSALIPNVDAMVENLRHFAKVTVGLEARPITTLADSRPFVHLHALSWISAKTVRSIPETEIARETRVNAAGVSEECVGWKRWPELAASFLKEGRFPGEALGLPPSRAVGRKELGELPAVAKSLS